MFDELSAEGFIDHKHASNANDVESIPVGKEIDYVRILYTSIQQPKFGEIPQPRKINHYPFDSLEVGDYFTVRKDQFGFGSVRQAVHSRNTREPGKRYWSVRINAARTEYRVFRMR